MHYLTWNVINCCTAVNKFTLGKACSRWMTLKVTHDHPNCCNLIGHISLPISGLWQQWLQLASFPRPYNIYSVTDWTWPWEVHNFWKDSFNSQFTCALRFMCKHIADNTYNNSQGMGDRNTSDSRSDLQGHSSLLVMVPLDWPHMIFY